MEKLSQPQAILTLGKKIVAELEEQQSLDTMDRWLAHHISEKMVKADNEAEPILKAQLEKDCCDLILSSWERRFNKSGKFSPLFQLEETLEVLEAFVIENYQDWRPRSEKTKGKFELFAEKLNDSFYRINEAMITLSVLPDKFVQAHAWHKEMPHLLSAEEQKLVESLNTLIERGLKREGISFEELYDQQINPPSESYVVKIKKGLIETLKELVEMGEKL